VGFLTLVLLAAACEVFDFPPYRGIWDAHSVWHSLTVPMIPVWYFFWIEDCKWELRGGVKKRDS
jgi:hypothetical protein